MISSRQQHRIRLFSSLFRLIALIVASSVPLVNTACYAQDSIDLKAESPERRKILQLLEQLNTIARDEFLQAVDAFDAAWGMAVLREDPLLNLNTDVQQILNPGQSQLYAGARAKLQQVFETAPEEFRRRYRQQMEIPARASLQNAIDTSSVSDLTQVILRYQFTEAGQHALENLIRLKLSRGELLQTALQFGRLLRLREDKSPASQSQLAVLWWQAGLEEEAIDCLRPVVQQAPGQQVSLWGTDTALPQVDSEIPAWLQTTARGTDENRSTNGSREWLQPLGNYRRTLNQSVGSPELSEVWSDTTFSCIERTSYNPMLSTLASGMEDDLEAMRARSDTVIPVASPLLAGDALIFRTATNIRAVDRLTGECLWETVHTDRQMTAIQQSWQPDSGDLPSISINQRDELINHWLRSNSGGQLTCDGRTVFVVEESTEETMQVARESRPQPQPKATNYLRAYDLETGMTRGQAGGPIGTSITGGLVNPLTGMYFLGAPLVMGDRIYAVAESDQGIFLLQLRATPLYAGELSEADMQPVWSQLLSIPRHPLRAHPLRKYAGIIPSFGRGLLICNTCDEQIIAMSAEDHAVRWIYRYPSNVTVPEMNPNIAVIGSVMDLRESDAVDMAARWTDCLPRIVGDRVLLTPRDSDLLLCLQLETGKQLWTLPRGDHRTIAAVTADHVILTGSTAVECLQIATGESVWKTSVDTGRISGNAVTNGRTLQIPTSAPEILTLDLQTGRQLVSQRLSSIPGNLLSADGQLFSQSVTTVTCLGKDASQPTSPLAVANRHLIAGDVVAGEDELRKVLTDDSELARQEARTLLVRTLLEGIRLDYTANAGDVSEVRTLIESSSPSDQLVTNFTHAMLGMTLADVAVLPVRWEQINQSQQQLSTLQALVAEGQLQDLNEAPDVLAKLILRMLDESFIGKSSFASSANIAQRSHRVSAATIRGAMRLRSGDIVQQVAAIVNPEIVKRIRETQIADDVLWWLDMSLLSGFPEAVVEATNADVPVLPEFAVAIRDTALLQLADSPNAEVSARAAQLILNSAESEERWTQAAELAERTLGTSLPHGRQVVDVSPNFSLSRYGILSDSAATLDTLQSVIARAKAKMPEQPWLRTPVVTESDARSVSPQLNNNTGAVERNLPLFGTPGNFGGWEFLQTDDDSQLHAYDQSGRPRWTLRFGDALQTRQREYESSWGGVTTRHVLACGNLLATKINHQLSVFDCSHANLQQSPELLWQIDIRAVIGDRTPQQIFSRGFERTTQFDMQPSGLFPVGPFTAHGIAVSGGQRLSMLNALTGRREWQAHGLPRDLKMTATSDALLLISEATAQVEIRDLIDGAVRKVTALPAWWTDASENSASSVRMFQPEPGENLLWRIAVVRGQCLVYRRNTEACALESHSLSTNQTLWSIPLPADSLVSNIVNGHVAVLSDANRVQIYDLNRGSITADVEVPPAPQGMYLYLRNSGGQWVVVTDTFDVDRDVPVVLQGNVLVSGYAYSIRQQDGSLTWSVPIKHECLRILRTKSGPSPPTAPLLTLMSSWFPRAKDTTRGPGGSALRVKVFDVRTGDIIYEDDDVGRTQNYLWTRLNPEKNTVELSFEKRVITFDYRTQK